MRKIIIILVFILCYVQAADVEEITEISAVKEDIYDKNGEGQDLEQEGGLTHEEDMKYGSTEEKKGKIYEEDTDKGEEAEEEGEEDEDLYMEDTNEEDDEHGHSSEDDSKSFEQKMIQKPLEVIIRCSRRFTPGICMAPVVSVWTYVFDQQNCTERLGCHQVERANRFHNYNRCNRMCMALSNVYSKVLDMEKFNKDVSKREYGMPRRFGGIQINDIKDMTDLPPLSKTSSENENRPLARQYYDYVERQKSLSYDDYTAVAGADDLVPIDIDDFRVQSEVWDDFYRNFE